MRVLALLATALLAACATPAPEPLFDPATQRMSGGHGFFVDNAGHVLTNRHVVAGCTNIRVSSPVVTLRRATLVALPERKDVDLALLKTDYFSRNALAFRDTWPVPPPQIGWVQQVRDAIPASVVIYDNQRAESRLTPVSIVANRRSAQDTKILVLQGNVVHGNSGSPIIHADGRVIGVTYARLEADTTPLRRFLADQPGGFAMAAQEAMTFLSANRIRPLVTQQRHISDQDWHAAVVRVLCVQPRPANEPATGKNEP